MKRADAISYIRIAGYHDDRKAMTRLYIENRVGLAAADEAFRIGARQRAGGMPCTCSACAVKKPTTTP